MKLLRVLQERVFCRVGSTRSPPGRRALRRRDPPRPGSRRARGPFPRGPVLSAGGHSHPDPAAARAARGRRAAGARAARAHRRRARAARRRASPTTRWRRCARWRWPGNVRELGNVLERALVLRAPGDDRAAHGRRGGRVARRGAARAGRRRRGTSLASKVDALERPEIEAALRRARGVKAAPRRRWACRAPRWTRRWPTSTSTSGAAERQSDARSESRQPPRCEKNRERSRPEVLGPDRPRSPATDRFELTETGRTARCCAGWRWRAR